MMNAEQIRYLLADITGGIHDGETFIGSLHLVDRVGLQIRDLERGGFMEKVEAIGFLVGIREELQAMLAEVQS